MQFIRTMLGWIVTTRVEPRRAGESCTNCCHFADHSSDDDLPDEPNGYCCVLVDKLGLDAALKINEYGGHWTHSGSWCSEWEGGPSLWPVDSPQSVAAVDPSVPPRES